VYLVFSACRWQYLTPLSWRTWIVCFFFLQGWQPVKASLSLKLAIFLWVAPSGTIFIKGYGKGHCANVDVVKQEVVDEQAVASVLLH
jgi:hypothetical protein